MLGNTHSFQVFTHQVLIFFPEFTAAWMTTLLAIVITVWLVLIALMKNYVTLIVKIPMAIRLITKIRWFANAPMNFTANAVNMVLDQLNASTIVLISQNVVLIYDFIVLL